MAIFERFRCAASTGDDLERTWRAMIVDAGRTYFTDYIALPISRVASSAQVYAADDEDGASYFSLRIIINTIGKYYLLCTILFLEGFDKHAAHDNDFML